jgi:hypothetical protein
MIVSLSPEKMCRALAIGERAMGRHVDYAIITPITLKRRGVT